MQPSLLVIVAYLGPLPRMFDLWLESCARNPHVHWLVTNDREQQHDLPENVRFLQQSSDQLLERMRQKVGVAPSPFRPYKLCDFKATYGIMFEEELQGYDYWGMCDLDMLFGDMRKFLDLNALAAYTKIFWQGHLTIYRNTPDVNNTFRLPGPGWDSLEILQSPNAHLFDEKGGVHTIWRYHNLPVYYENLIADIHPNSPHMVARKQPNVHPQVFAWVDGRVLCFQAKDDRVEELEYMYIHFQKRRMPRGDFPRGESFYITPNGFIPFAEHPLTPATIAKLATPDWATRRDFWRRRAKEQVARLKRLYTREYVLRQPPPDVLPPDVT